MKRFFVFLLILCTVLCMPFATKIVDFANSFSGEYCFYTSQNFQSPMATTIKNGEGYIITCDIKNAKTIKNALNKNCLYGESFSFCGNQSEINKIMFDLDVMYSCKNDLDIIAYSPKVDYCVYLDQKPFNMQIACKDGLVFVGFPTIFGGF